MFRRIPRLVIVTAFVLFLIGGISFAIRFAKGYRPSLTNRALEGTGLLAANSVPEGASVFINDKLTTATDDTLNLTPGEYTIRIQQDGYIPWEKILIVEAELVTQTNARLFPSVPDLKPLTFTGANNSIPSPDGEKMAFGVENATTDDKNGLYVLELRDRTFSVSPTPRQIVRNTGNLDFNQAQLTWSADSNQILATFNSGEKSEANILLNAGNFNDAADLKDVTATLPVLIREWNEILDLKNHEVMLELPEFMQEFATSSARAVYFSPDDNKMLYTATASAQIPQELIPPLPATSTQAEDRDLKLNNSYIYDIEEDRNFWVSVSDQEPDLPSDPLQILSNRYTPLLSQNIQWFPDSRHVIVVEDNQPEQASKVVIAEYDGTNRHTVYAGPFSQNFAYPWPDGSKLLILASLNGGSNQPPNLYVINLK